MKKAEKILRAKLKKKAFFMPHVINFKNYDSNNTDSIYNDSVYSNIRNKQ